MPVELTSFNIIHRRRWKHLFFWWRIFNIVWNLGCISHLLLLLLYARLDFTASFSSVCKSKRFLITRRSDSREKARIQGIQYLKLWNYLSHLSEQHNQIFRYIIMAYKYVQILHIYIYIHAHSTNNFLTLFQFICFYTWLTRIT